jgi:hypothetical protein
VRERLWVEPTYDFGIIDGRTVVLQRGGDFYSSGALPAWKIYATTNDLDAARKIVAALSA